MAEGAAALWWQERMKKTREEHWEQCVWQSRRFWERERVEANARRWIIHRLADAASLEAMPWNRAEATTPACGRARERREKTRKKKRKKSADSRHATVRGRLLQRVGCCRASGLCLGCNWCTEAAAARGRETRGDGEGEVEKEKKRKSERETFFFDSAAQRKVEPQSPLPQRGNGSAPTA